MPIFHLTKSTIEPVATAAFQTLGVMERGDLQRVLRERLEVIVPDAMLLAEEFGDWTDGRRRIDLLALDRDANLVVIELKRTEDAGHVELQALRYAAMVSLITFEQAVSAHEAYLRRLGREGDARASILDFLGWEEAREGDFAPDVRIVLVASDFQKEITTTVLWLNDRELDIRCVRLQPYVFNGEVLVDVQQVIPLPEAAEYQVAVRERNEQRRHVAVGDRDRTKFDVTIGGSVQREVNKRRAVLLIVRGLAEAGVSQEDTMRIVPSRGDRFFISAAGRQDGNTFSVAARSERSAHGRGFDPARWFIGDDELIHFGERTYAVSNQWGTSTGQTLRELVGAFPKAGIEVSASS
jgi:hypothetical protein